MSSNIKVIVALVAVIGLTVGSFYLGKASADRSDYEYALGYVGIKSVGETAVHILKSRVTVSDSTIASWERCIEKEWCSEDMSKLDSLIKVPMDSLTSRIETLKKGSR